MEALIERSRKTVDELIARRGRKSSKRYGCGPS